LHRSTGVLETGLVFTHEGDATAFITWVEDQFVATGDSDHAIVMDSTAEAGQGGSPPQEVMLMGVLGCTAMDVISILKKKRQPVEGLKVFATTERAEAHPKRFLKIHLEYVALGAVELEALARAVQLSEEMYCSAMGTLRGPVEIQEARVAEAVGAWRLSQTARPRRSIFLCALLALTRLTW
jgi:putative redox protein